MPNIYYQSSIEYNFIKELNEILDLQYTEYKRQILEFIIQECNEKYKLLKTKDNKLIKNGESSDWN